MITDLFAGDMPGLREDEMEIVRMAEMDDERHFRSLWNGIAW